MVVVILESVFFKSESVFLLRYTILCFQFSLSYFVLNKSVNYQEVAGMAGYYREQSNLNFSHEIPYALLSNWNAYLGDTELIVNLQYLFANSLAWFSSKCP